MDTLPLLQDLAALSALAGDIGGSLVIARNTALDNIDALTSLTGVGTAIYLQDNPALRSLAGLSGVSGALGGDLFVTQNPSLETLEGLGGLRGPFGGTLQIFQNSSLTTLSGLSEDLSSVAGDLFITSNVLLQDCAALGQLLGAPDGPPADGVGGIIDIAGNATGCSTIQELLASADLPSSGLPIWLLDQVLEN